MYGMRNYIVQRSLHKTYTLFLTILGQFFIYFFTAAIRSRLYSIAQEPMFLFQEFLGHEFKKKIVSRSFIELLYWPQLNPFHQNILLQSKTIKIPSRWYHIIIVGVRVVRPTTCGNCAVYYAVVEAYWFSSMWNTIRCMIMFLIACIFFYIVWICL